MAGEEGSAGPSRRRRGRSPFAEAARKRFRTDEAAPGSPSPSPSPLPLMGSSQGQTSPREARSLSQGATRCVICQEGLDAGGLARVSGCAHEFCGSCIGRWAQVSTTCPLCKARFEWIEDVGAGTRVAVEKRDQAWVEHEEDEAVARELHDEELRRAAEEYEAAVARDADNDTGCMVCNGRGDDHLFLLCDSCDQGAHTYCVGLGYLIPRADWFCSDCAPARRGGSGSGAAAGAGASGSSSRLGGQRRGGGEGVGASGSRGGGMLRRAAGARRTSSVRVVTIESSSSEEVVPPPPRVGARRAAGRRVIAVVGNDLFDDESEEEEVVPPPRVGARGAAGRRAIAVVENDLFDDESEEDEEEEEILERRGSRRERRRQPQRQPQRQQLQLQRQRQRQQQERGRERRRGSLTRLTRPTGEAGPSRVIPFEDKHEGGWVVDDSDSDFAGPVVIDSGSEEEANEANGRCKSRAARGGVTDSTPPPTPPPSASSSDEDDHLPPSALVQESQRSLETFRSRRSALASSALAARGGGWMSARTGRPAQGQRGHEKEQISTSPKTPRQHQSAGPSSQANGSQRTPQSIFRGGRITVQRTNDPETLRRLREVQLAFGGTIYDTDGNPIDLSL